MQLRVDSFMYVVILTVIIVKWTILYIQQEQNSEYHGELTTNFENMSL